MSIIVIKNNRPSRVELSTPPVSLFPGENNVDEEAWELNKKNMGGRTLAPLLDAGILVECGHLVKGAPMTEDTNIVEIDEMLRTIAKCNKPEVLNVWGRSDERTQVRKAIEVRLKELKKQAADTTTETIGDDVEPLVQVPEQIYKSGFEYDTQPVSDSPEESAIEDDKPTIENPNKRGRGRPRKSARASK